VREEIIDAVLLEIAEDGLAGLTLKAVAARADTSIRLSTHHFINRAGLLSATAERWQESLKDAESQCLSAFMSRAREQTRCCIRQPYELHA